MIKVLDFGLAKVKSEGAVDGGLTHDGQMLGTPDYVAPEQIRDARRADIRADIYSLGCTLYCLLTGGPPFHADKSLRDPPGAPLDGRAAAEPGTPRGAGGAGGARGDDDGQRAGAAVPDTKGRSSGASAFFQEGNRGAVGPRAEMSPPRGGDQDRTSTRALSVPTHTAAKTPSPSVAPPLETPSAASSTEPAWESLIKFKTTEPLERPAQAVTASTRSPRWIWPSVAVGLLLIGLIVAWAVTVRVKTSNGVIELVDLPKYADVFIDGEKVAVNWPSGGKPAVISVSAGKKHKIRVKKDGMQFEADEVTIEADGKEEFTVRFVPLADLPEVTGQADDRPARSENEGAILSEGPPDLPLEAVEKRGASSSAVARPANAPLVKQEMPPAARPSKPVGKMSSPNTRLVHVDEFNGPQRGFLKDLEIPHDPNHGRSDGVYFVYAPGGWRTWVIHDIPSDGTCEVVARVSSKDPAKTATWCVLVGSKAAARGFLVKINVKGELFLEPNPWPGAIAFRQIDPRIGPIVHRAIKPGNEFNKLLLVMSTREVVISVNDVQVCAPVRFDYNVTPSRLQFGVAGPGKKRAEFDRVEIREMIRPEEAAPKHVAEPAVKPDAVKPAAPAKPKPTLPINPVKLIVKSIGMTLNLIPAGEFMMGSPGDDKDAALHEKPQHKVRISPFYIGVTEVTQAQYEAVVGSNPSHFSSTGEGKDKVAGRPTGQYPVERVSWLDAVRFCDKLSEKEGRTPVYQESDQKKARTNKGRGYRLPMEAEWEYACRAGTATKYCFGDPVAKLSEYGWFRGNAGGMTHPVGEKRPNGFGVYDMHGNVREWCSDWFDDSYYQNAPVNNPQGPSVGVRRVIRGGTLGDRPPALRSAGRSPGRADGRGDGLGFRVALGLPKSDPEGGPATKSAGDPSALARGATKSHAEIPEDATLFAGKHYKVINRPLTWHEARTECERMGGHLVIIRDQDENRFVMALLAKSDMDAAWLGATDERSEGRWFWVDGTEMRYNAWDAKWRQPDNRSNEDGREENYVIIVVSRNGGWVDQPLQGEKKWHPGFVCEW